jgi:hypothetical protein
MKRKLAIAFIALLAAAIAAAMIAERNAEAAAQALCRQFPPGSDFRAALAAAASQGERRLATADSITVFFVGLPPFSRHNCEIRGADGKVRAARYFHLD